MCVPSRAHRTRGDFVRSLQQLFSSCDPSPCTPRAVCYKFASHGETPARVHVHDHQSQCTRNVNPLDDPKEISPLQLSNPHVVTFTICLWVAAGALLSHVVDLCTVRVAVRVWVRHGFFATTESCVDEVRATLDWPDQANNVKYVAVWLDLGHGSNARRTTTVFLSNTMD
jgi:hypothetical protein